MSDHAVTRTPKIFVIDRPVLQPGVESFLKEQNTTWRRDPSATDAELLVEIAGRLCYMSFGETQSPKTNRQYIAHLINSGHESVLEHAGWSFILTGVTRSLTHQFVRHRIGFSYSQLSQQYHDQTEANFIMPRDLENYPDAVASWREATSNAARTYRDILSKLPNIAGQTQAPSARREMVRAMRSAARSVLPNATETAIFVSANARALRHFLAVRGSTEGDMEMRGVSAALLESILPDAPSVFFDFSIEQAGDGYPIVVHHLGKKLDTTET